MKKTTILKLSAAFTLLISGATIASSLAWFRPTATVTPSDTPVEGVSEGAYYAYGNGLLPTAQNPTNKPYGITRPRHLYNLAWLQYLGFYNKGTQYYFEIAMKKYFCE